MSTQSTDKALREEVALDQLQAHNAAIAKGVRLSGSADEAEAFDYIAAQCEAFGLTVQRYAVDALVSLPGAASLSVTGPEARDFPCITHSASRPTGPGGITASLVYAGDGLAADYAKIEARGKIALVEGLAGAPKAADGDAAGVLGIICINPEGLHEMNFSPVWGCSGRLLHPWADPGTLVHWLPENRVERSKRPAQRVHGARDPAPIPVDGIFQHIRRSPPSRRVALLAAGALHCALP